MASKKISVQTRPVTSLDLSSDLCKQGGDENLSPRGKGPDPDKLVSPRKGNGCEDMTTTPTTTVTTNSLLSSSISTTTATTISTRQYNLYSNIISNTLLCVNDTGLKNSSYYTCTSKELSHVVTPNREAVLRSKAASKDVCVKSKPNNEAPVKPAKNKEVPVKCTKTCPREVSFHTPENEPLCEADKNFSSVLKGTYTTYRKKYLEGPIVGRGSFGVVRTLFSMVEILDLYQYIPSKIRPPLNNLARGIKRISDNNYEFCGMKLTSPTRAAKIMNFDKIKKTGAKNLLHILREVSIGSWNDHPNIVKVKEIYLNEQIIHYLNNISTLDDREIFLTGKNNNVYLVMEYCGGGDLSRLVIDEVNKEAMVPKIFLQIFRALSYINAKGIAHRDVKPENFLISHDTNVGAYADKDDSRSCEFTVKLADFGLANSSPRLLKTRAGTPYYVAPEIIKCSSNNHYSVKCDSWSAGIMLHIFLLGTCPFHDDSDVKKLNKVVNEEIDWTHEIYATIPPEAYDLLRKLLVKNPCKRLSTTDALKHVYFQKFRGYTPVTKEINGNLLIDRLIQFFKFPTLKQVALCIMIRQISEHKLCDLSDLYKYLTSFSDDFNTLDLLTLTNYVNYYNTTHLNKDVKYNDKIDKLYYLSESMNVDSISFTEFVASQMAPELCQNNDLIANIFAGLHSDLPGRRSLFINEHDLARLTTNYTHDCSAPFEGKVEHSDENRRCYEQVYNHINMILNDACDYADKIYAQNKLKGSSYGLGGFLRSPRDADRVASMSIDEFFLMMSFNPINEYSQEELRRARIKRKRMK